MFERMPALPQGARMGVRATCASRIPIDNPHSAFSPPKSQHAGGALASPLTFAPARRSPKENAISSWKNSNRKLCRRTTPRITANVVKASVVTGVAN